MENVSVKLNEKGPVAFFLKEGEEKLGEMIVAIADNKLTVFHTEVFAAEGKGLGKVLLNFMADYARQHQLKVVPRCLFVQAQFKRHPQLYDDIMA